MPGHEEMCRFGGRSKMVKNASMPEFGRIERLWARPRWIGPTAAPNNWPGGNLGIVKRQADPTGNR